MEDLLRDWDGEFVVVRYDRPAAAWMFVAIHSTRLGAAVGGTRMRAYETPADGLRDAQRLAAGMTYKWAGIDFPLGGGKAVIALTRALEGAERERLLERYGSLVDSLNGEFMTGLDLGITPEDIEVIARRTEYVHGRSPEHGGAGDPGPWTALGVYAGMRAAAAAAFGSPDLADRTVLIQGVGDVGVPLGRRLKEAGASLKLADLDAGRAAAYAEELDAHVVDPERAYEEPCDIFAPCAVGGVLNEDTIARIRCGAVAGSANNQLGEAVDAERLHARGILYAPDFIINAGGAIALLGLEARGMSEAEVRERTLGIEGTLGEIFAEATDRDESPLHAATRRAERILKR